MRIVVVGGSNSVSKEGYVGHFIDRMSDHFSDIELINISSGGTTSLTSLVGINNIQGDVDLFIIEYSLNDTGHLNHRENGGSFKTDFLRIMFGLIKAKFPHSKILPLILSSEPFYDLGVPNSVYESELAYFSKNGLYFHDMRRELFHMFGGQPPYFLYSDIAHFHRGFASSIIGRTLGMSAQWLMDPASHKNVISDVTDTVHPTIISAQGLNKNAQGCVATATNRHMSLDYLEISKSQSLECTISGWPICLYFASDSQHVDLEVEIEGQRLVVGTRHLDCREGKFILTSVPLILNHQYMRSRRNGEVTMKLSLAGDAPVWTFDCLESHTPSGQGDRVRIVAVATLDAC